MRILRVLWPVPFTLLIVWAVTPKSPALADEPGVTLGVPERQRDLDLAPRALPAPVLAVEVLDALRYWTRRPEDVLRPWANAVADATCDGVCDDVTRADAIWIASQAAVESRFADYVLDFRCNRRTHVDGVPFGACDHGWAIGPWQMHDLKMLDASPATQAARAVQWMHARPQAWTTWRAARSQADAWLRAHP